MVMVTIVKIDAAFTRDATVPTMTLATTRMLLVLDLGPDLVVHLPLQEACIKLLHLQESRIRLLQQLLTVLPHPMGTHHPRDRPMQGIEGGTPLVLGRRGY